MKKLIILLAVVTLSITAFSQNVTKKSFTDVKTIKISTISGDCEIRKSSGNTVEVELAHSLGRNDFAPTMEQSGDRLEIAEQFKGNRYDTIKSKNGATQLRLVKHGPITWKLSIPDHMRIMFNTGSGSLTVSDVVDISLSATTGAGNLEFSSLNGVLDATTGSGNVEMSKFSGHGRINTGSGSMNVADSDGELSMNCGSGNIRITNVKAEFSVNTGSGHLDGDRIVLTGSGNFNTGSGRAKVTLDESPKFDITVNAGSGRAELNFNGNEINGEVVMKASKEHGSISAPFEFDKTEVVDSRHGSGNVTTVNGNSFIIVKTAQRGKGTNRITLSTGSGDAVLRK